MKKIAAYLLLLLVSICFSSNAQDAHFTQFMKSGAALNPAAAGQNVEHIRATLLYRNQWASVTSPFTTQAFFFDKAINRVGLGFNVINNSAGEAGIRQLHFNGNLAYTFSVRKSRIAAGIQIGLLNKSFDPSKMTFDDQYVQDQGFNSSNPTSETFSYTKLTRPDLGAGLHWSREPGEKIQPYAGISIQHINQPQESFILDNNIIPVKYTFNSGVAIRVNDQVTVSPMILYSQQFTAKEIVVGSVVKLPMQDRNNVEGGIFYRHKDAVAIYAGYQWNSVAAGLSYDVNISGVTGGPGAFELTLTYIPKAKEKKTDAPKKEKEKKEKSTVPSGDSHATEIKGAKQKTEKAKAEAVAPAEEVTKKQSPAKSVAKSEPVVKDSDGDGIADSEDECIYMKGTAATKGCPDSDNDGVTDNLDACPMIKGSTQNKGCPATESVALTKEEKAAAIQFKTNSDEVKGIIRLEVIEPILDELYANPTWKVVISGHTDSEGTELYNMDLSQRRAEKIRAIFLRKGLEENRISTVSYGETKPLDDNRSEEGKAANRRAEIHILK
jgi:type IX secretion system PorP/SprF family membrane protein